MFGSDEKKKKLLTISFFAYAVILLLTIIMMNFEKFSTFVNWINDKLSIFTPIILGGIIAYLCTPLVRLFQKLLKKAKMKNNSAIRGLSILFSYLVLLGVVIIFVFLVGPQLISSIEDLMKKMTDGTFMNLTLDKVNEFLNRFISDTNEENLQFIDIDKINNAISKFFMNSENILQQGLGVIISYAERIFVGIKNVFIGFLLSIYFVINKERLSAQCKKILSAIFSKKRFDSIIDWTKFTDKTFGGFIVGKLLDALFMIIACGVVFTILKIPYAILISVVIGISNLIPFFGPFIGAIPSGLIILIANPSKFFLFIIVLLIIQQFDANVIEPKIVGTRTGLTSLGVIVAIIIMSGYFGIIGMFFGVPIFAVICSILKSIIESQLTKKKLPTDLAEYYSETSIIDPRRTVESLNSRIFHWSERKLINGKNKTVLLFSKATRKKFFMTKKEDDNITSVEDSTSNDDDNKMSE